MDTDFLVVGSGLAGMLFALKASRHGRVLLLTKGQLEESNSRYAQGGVATVWDDEDHFESHVKDTLVAGAGLCRRSAVEFVVENGPARIQELIDLGVEFTRDQEQYDLTREGGHSHRRILHAKDQTGAEIVRALLARLVAHPDIEVRENTMVVDLVTQNRIAKRSDVPEEYPDRVVGAYVLDVDGGEVYTVRAKVVALCAGGAGKVYRYTSNPDVATGDGIAMAWRAGAQMANMEFVQFHPTCLFHPEAKSFLISEALRGEGGFLRNEHGERFMESYDARLELAPRDIVARAIDAEIKRLGSDCVFLDMTHLDGAFLEDHFPAIFARCVELGIDMRTTPIPVVPACHYFCGGVLVDERAEASIQNLFVVGESSCTGLHGANRLASNSLLEAAVYAHAAAAEAATRLGRELTDIAPWDAGRAIEPDELVVIKHTWAEIRQFMWDYVGIVRTTRRLKRARHRVKLVKEEIRAYYWEYTLSRDMVELRNLADVADLVVECALRRRESRGLHYTLDHPESGDRWLRDTVVSRRL